MPRRLPLTFLLTLVVFFTQAQESNTHQCNDHCRSLNASISNNNLVPPVISVEAATTTVSCPLNIDFELGNFTRWQTNIGTVDTVINLTDTLNVIDLPAASWLGNTNTPPSPQRQVLMDRLMSGIDYYGQFPVNPPNRGGRYALKLGSDEDALDAPAHGYPNKKAESARYIVNVPNPANDYSITFSYAVILENPDGTSGGGGGGGGTPNIHQNFAQPRFRVRMYDANTGELVPCANFDFVADESLPGFFNSIHSYEHRPDAAVKCKAWTDVFVNLSRYAGRTLYLEFTTADCTYGGHFGYAYVDVVECGLNASGLYHCDNQTATMTGPPGFQNYAWYNNSYSAQVGSGQVITVSNTSPGSNYWCVVTPFNNTGCTGCVCKDTLGVKVVATFPVANAGNPSTVCRSDSVAIGSVPISGYAYGWSPASGLSSAVVANPLAAPTVQTDYIVTVTDTLTRCSTKDTVRISLYPRPVPAFTIDDNTQCMPGNQFHVSSSSSISSGTLNTTWFWGDGTTTVNAVGASHSYANPGTYHIKMVVQSDMGCTDSFFRYAYVYTQPVAAFQLNTNNACINNNNISIQATGIVAAYQYHWNLGDGNTFTGANPPAHQYAFPGNYQVSLTVTTNNGCVDTLPRQLTIHQQPDVQLISMQPPVICRGDSVQLSAIYAAVDGIMQTINWYYNGIPLSSVTDSTFFVYQPGDYAINVTNSWGCSRNDTISIVVHDLPNGNLQTPASTTICQGSDLLLTATGGTHYQWFINGNPIAGANNATYLATTPGVYLVDIFNAEGCHIAAASPVTLHSIERPHAQFILENSCVNIPVQCNNLSQVGNSGNVTYSWFADGALFSNIEQPAYSFSIPGNHQIQLVIHTTACPQLTDTAFQSFNIVTNPGGIRYMPVDVVKYRNQQLDARNFGTVYQWSPGNGLNVTTRRNPVFNYDRDMEYLIRLTDQFGCPVTDTQLVRVFGKGDIYVPNAFTPDRSGNANDYMYPILVGMIELRYFRIFDRWGRMMFETSRARPGWNGIFNGKPQPMDTYTWTVEAVDIDGRVITRSGNCVLIR